MIPILIAGGASISGGIFGRRSARRAARAAAATAEQDALNYWAVAQENRRRAIQDAHDIVDIARMNQAVLREDAQAAAESAEAEVAGIATEENRLLGQQRAAYGTSGIVLASGSPLMVMQESHRMAIDNINNAVRTGYIQAKRLISQANIVGAEAEAQSRRFVDEADIIAKTARMEVSRIRTGGSIQSAELKRHGTQMMIHGLGGAAQIGMMK